MLTFCPTCGNLLSIEKKKKKKTEEEAFDVNEEDKEEDKEDELCYTCAAKRARIRTRSAALFGRKRTSRFGIKNAWTTF